MKKWILSLALIAGIISLTACNGDDSGAIAETKAGDITKDEFYNAMKERYGKEVLQELIYEKVLADKYEVSDEMVDEEINKLKKQYGDSYEMVLLQNQITEETLRENIKMNLLVEKAAIKDVKATDEELQEFYDNYKPEIKARHILVEDEETAKEVKQKLDSGSKFEDLAKEYSTDTASAENGGDLGWFGAGEMVAEFEEAAYALDVNEISNPVKSELGYHIIQVTEKEEKKSYEDMKTEVEHKVKVAKLDSTAITEALQRELKDADAKINDDDLKAILDTTSANTGEAKE